MYIKYEVTVESFAERHYIATFAKKYKKAWDFTRKIILEEFEKFDVLFLKTIAKEITDKNADVIICKTEIRVSGTQESRHGSGNRCIVAKQKNTNKICVLLVYHKNDLGEGNETANWKRVIKENYSEYKEML